MSGFLKKLKSLVAGAETPAPQAGKGGRKPQTKAAHREPEPAPQQNALAEKQDERHEKDAAAGANAGIVAPRSQGSAPMPAASSATPAVVKRHKPLDMNRVDLADAWEVQYRRKQFGCTELQLKQAVAAVGDSADKIKLFLRRKSVPPKGGKQRYE